MKQKDIPLIYSREDGKKYLGKYNLYPMTNETASREEAVSDKREGVNRFSRR
ncbi:MAG: hypothetical protein ACLUDU_06275 [Butyricimonas faecihominis]